MVIDLHNGLFESIRYTKSRNRVHRHLSIVCSNVFACAQRREPLRLLAAHDDSAARNLPVEWVSFDAVAKLTCLLSL